MAYETIDFKADGPVARITLNRPDRLNSFTAQMHEEMRDALANLGDARVARPDRRGPWLLRRAGPQRARGCARAKRSTLARRSSNGGIR